MQKNKGIILIGAGGHASVVLDALQASGYTGRLAIMANDISVPSLLGEVVHIGYPEPNTYPPSQWKLHVAIGDNALRKQLCDKFMAMNYELVTIRHPTSVVSPYAEIGQGSAVMACAIINPRVRIGCGVIVNTSAVIEHDCTLGDWSHASPGAVMAGNSHAGSSCWIGACTVLRQGARLMSGITVGASSVVLDTLSEPGTYVGRPATFMKKD